MKVTITGATGLVGSNLALELIRQGHEVRCTRRATSRIEHLEGEPIEWVEADLADVHALTRAFEGRGAVFHCAAAVAMHPTPTPTMIAANVEGTRNVLDAVRAGGVGRLVHCSSTVAVGLSTDGEPVDEDADWNFDRYGLGDGYATTKLESEILVRAATVQGVDAVIVNPTFMFGPFDPKPSSGKMIMEILHGRAPACSPGVNNFVDVRDVARGMILALERGRMGERYILGGQNMRYPEIMGLIAEVGGVRGPRFVIPRFLANIGGGFGDLMESFTGRERPINSTTVAWGYADNFMFSSEKARRELGYTTGPLEVAIRDAIAWFRVRGML